MRGGRLSYIMVRSSRMNAMRHLLTVVVLGLVAGASSMARAQDDWSVQRSEFDPRVVARYKAMLARSPNDGYALGKLVGLYKKHRSLAALIGEYKAAAKTNPDSFATQVILGHLHRRASDNAQAAKHYEKAGQLNPKSPTVPAALGALYQKLGRPAEAREAYQKALALSSSVKEKKGHLRSLAQLALTERDLPAARKYYDQLVALEPKNTLLRMELAQALAKSGATKEAIEQYQLILKRTSDSATKADVMKEIGGLQAQSGQEMEAVATYRKAMALTTVGHWLRKELTDRIIAIYRAKEQLKDLIAYYEKTWTHKGAFELDILARLYDETGDEAKALKSYRAALKASPQAVDTRVRLVALLERGGQDKEVIAEYRKLVQIAPGDPKFAIELAKRLYRAGQQKDAIAVLDSVASRFSGDASVHSALADLYARWGDQKRAMKSAQVLVRIEPKDPSHLINLGEQLFLQGQKKKAVETWKRLLAVVKERHAGYAKLAEIYAQHEMVKEAIELYQKAIKLAPKNLAYHRELAGLHERKQQTTEAIRAWESVLALGKSLGKPEAKREARTRIIEILHRTYQLRYRLNTYQRAFDGSPPDLDAGFFLAEAHQKLGQDAQAALVYQRILERDKDNLDAMTALEGVYRKQRKLAPAVELLKRMAVLQPTRAREIYQRIAELLLQLYRDKEALAYAHKAVALGPQDALSYQRLGELYEKKEDYEGAAKAYQRAIQLDPSRVRVHFALARLNTQQGRYAEAEKLYRQVVVAARTPETVLKAFRLVVDLSDHLGKLDTLEKEILPLSVTSANAETYRRLLVQIYQRRVPALIDRVRHGDSKSREVARRELHAIGVRGLPPLLEELAATQAPPRRLIRMLGYLGNPGAVIPLLRIAEKEADEEVTTIYGSTGSGYYYGAYYNSPYRSTKASALMNRRVEATVAAGRIAEERAVPGLLRLLASKEAALREASAWSLARIKDPRAGKALLGALADSRPFVETMACAGLGVQGNASMRPVLEEVMLDRERRIRVRSACAWALGVLGQAKATDPLIEALQQGEDDIQRAAAWSLGMLGDKRALPALSRALWSRRGPVRRAILWAMLRIAGGPAGKPPLPPEVPIRDGKLDEEDLVARLTREVDEPPAGAPQKTLAGVLQAQQGAIVDGLQSALSRHRDVAVRVLADLDARPELPSLGPFTASSDQLAAGERASLERTVEAVTRRVAPQVAALLGHSDSAVRLRALSVYGKLGASDLAAQVERALRDPQWEVRIAALEALAVGQRRGAVSRPVLLRLASTALRSGHWRQRETAVKLAAGLRDASAAPVLAGALRDANGFVREQAALGLGATGSPAWGGGTPKGEAIPALTAALDDEVPHVRAAACQSLAALRAPGARTRVSALSISDPSPLVRTAAQRALKTLP
jgi:cellulose synthase operon protein C